MFLRAMEKVSIGTTYLTHRPFNRAGGASDNTVFRSRYGTTVHTIALLPIAYITRFAFTRHCSLGLLASGTLVTFSVLESDETSFRAQLFIHAQVHVFSCLDLVCPVRNKCRYHTDTHNWLRCSWDVYVFIYIIMYVYFVISVRCMVMVFNLNFNLNLMRFAAFILYSMTLDRAMSNISCLNYLNFSVCRRWSLSQRFLDSSRKLNELDLALALTKIEVWNLLLLVILERIITVRKFFAFTVTTLTLVSLEESVHLTGITFITVTILHHVLRQAVNAQSLASPRPYLPYNPTPFIPLLSEHFSLPCELSVFLSKINREMLLLIHRDR